MPHLLEAVEFRDPARARRDLAQLAAELSPESKHHLELLLSASPDADSALPALVSLKQRRPEHFLRLVSTPASLRSLIAVVSYSRFLSEEILKNPDWLESADRLEGALSAGDYSAQLEALLASQSGPPEALTLAMFRRRHILRILLRDVLNFATLPEITEELSNLADAILDVSYRRIRADMAARYGMPLYQDESGAVRECGMAVIALGKLGGQELNYSSDIDLMFVYTASGQTNGPHPISNKEFYKKIANQYTHLLSTYTAEGMCYRVDLRLRPDGSLGEVALSLDGAKKYYQTRARDWELQMLIKARVAAGDRETGRELLEAVEPLTYSTTLDFSAVEAVSATRERIGEKLNQRRGGKASAFDVKLARGGIRDIEFLVQCLQRLHGGRTPWVRHGGTLRALARLNDKDLLSAAEYSRLVSAYRFLRNLEHRLQTQDDRQTHTLPSDPGALDRLARQMPLAQLGGTRSGEKLLRELNSQLESVREIYDRVVHLQKPLYYGVVGGAAAAEPDPAVEPASTNLAGFLGWRAPQLVHYLSSNTPRMGVRAFEHLLEKAAAHPAWLALLNDRPAVVRHTLDIFEHSPYLADELLRTPALLEDVATLGEPEPAPSTAPPLLDPADLRQFFRREMFRVQIASLCLAPPVFETLARTSDLAEAAIAAAYRIATDRIFETHPPSNPRYACRDRLMVISLGRLGMREFDLASDADLLFVLPDEDQSELVFWTRVANRMIDIVGAYTGSGCLFAVDTRLRPNGGAGALVQCEKSYQEYFEKSAEAWEGIAYLKSRAVAGDLDRATRFLHALQEVDWRRWGQSGRSRKDLRQMRVRLEKEQGARNPLKAGPGGFFDIDFALLYLRLKSAGLFFRVLNTPERIDIVEKIGHLDRAEAEFLRDSACFYRAIDHGLRLYSGHAEGNLPNSEGQLQMLTEVVHRWTPAHLNRQPLRIQLQQIRARTREIFDQLFG